MCTCTEDYNMIAFVNTFMVQGLEDFMYMQVHCMKYVIISRFVPDLFSCYFHLYTGITIGGVVDRTIKGILLDTSMDSPARSAWLNLKQYNGYNGCNTCTEPGEQLDLGPGKKNARRQCHIYPFNKEYAQTTGHAKLRTHEVVKQQALVAMSQISKKGKVSASIRTVNYVTIVY